MLERGMQVDHPTIYRWVQHYAPELEKRCRPHLNTTNDSWRVDETYVKVKTVWMYLYRAVDAAGNTLEFRLSPTRDAQAAKAFFAKTLAVPHSIPPSCDHSRSKMRPIPKPSVSSKPREPFQKGGNCGKSSTSTTSSNKITASSNDG